MSFKIYNEFILIFRMENNVGYIKEFNKLVQDINFLSPSHDISLSNKLILIKQDLGDAKLNFDSFEVYNFYSNIFNILNQCGDTNSILSNSCIDVLLKTTESHNASLLRAMNFVNFLPAIIKLILYQDANEEKMVKLLTLVKNIIRSTHSELDEHNTKLIIEVLRDCVENSKSDPSVSKLSFNILSTLIMKNITARYQVVRILNSSKLGEKVKKASDLVGLKFLVVIANEVNQKDFTHLITLSFKSIRDCTATFDFEPLSHSLDLLEYAEKSKTNWNICECEENLKYLEDLNSSLIIALENNPDHSMIKEEFFNNIFAFYAKVLKMDNGVAVELENFVSEVFKFSHFLRSEKALNFLTTLLRNSGKISKILISEILSKFIEDDQDENKITLKEKSSLLKFLQACIEFGILDDDHFYSVSKFITTLIDIYEAKKLHDADQDLIFLIVHLIKTLSLLSNSSNIFREKLNEILSHEYAAILLARAFLTKDKEVLISLMTFGLIENYPSEKVAHLLSNSYQGTLLDESKSREIQQKAQSSSNTSKYINRIMGSELDTLINRINDKLDNNELDSLKNSEIISLFRHKNNYYNNHLNALNASLDKSVDLCQELQHQNSVFRKIVEKQELVNWCLEMDNENLQKENHTLVDAQSKLKSSISSFQNKITKENQAKAQAQKLLKLKELETESRLSLFSESFSKLNFTSQDFLRKEMKLKLNIKMKKRI